VTRVESKEGRFTVSWPGRVKLIKRDARSLRTATGELTVTTESLAVKDGPTLSVTWTDYPPRFATLEPAKLLAAVRDGMGSKDARLTEEPGQPVGADGTPVPLPGREFTWDHGKTLARTRLFLAGTRLYQVTASGPKDAVQSKAAEVFILSFEPTK
jgi:hypothetical protein